MTQADLFERALLCAGRCIEHGYGFHRSDDPASLTQDLDTVREWMAAGVDIEWARIDTTVRPTAAGAVATVHWMIANTEWKGLPTEAGTFIDAFLRRSLRRLKKATGFRG